jgi:hypothetical protein
LSASILPHCDPRGHFRFVGRSLFSTGDGAGPTGMPWVDFQADPLPAPHRCCDRGVLIWYRTGWPGEGRARRSSHSGIFARRRKAAIAAPDKPERNGPVRPESFWDRPWAPVRTKAPKSYDGKGLSQAKSLVGIVWGVERPEASPRCVPMRFLPPPNQPAALRARPARMPPIHRLPHSSPTSFTQALWIRWRRALPGRITSVTHRDGRLALAGVACRRRIASLTLWRRRWALERDMPRHRR